jgi:hypothetical protein
VAAIRIPGTALTLGRSREYAPAPSSTATRTGNPRPSAGADGTSIFYDLMPGGADSNPELSGWTKFVVYDEMRKSDAAVKSALFMYKLPIRRTKWIIEPASEDGIDQVIHEACCWQFGLEDEEGQLDLSWDEWTQQTLQFLDFGAMAEELIEGDVQLWRPRGDDGTNSRIVRPFARFAPRYPATIERIDTDPATGKIKRVRQNLPNTDWIPGDRLAWYAPDRDGGGWYGTSMLRAMYGPWKLKTALMISAAVGWDRFAYGTPVIRYPTGSGMKQEAERIGGEYRTHERAWIVFEGPKPTQPGMDGWDIEIVNGAQSIGDPTPLIRMYEEMIAASALQQFSRLGTTNTGARAVAEVLVEPFYDAVNSYAEYLAARRRRDAFRRFVDVNFGTEFAIPTLRPAEVKAKNALQLAQIISLLAAAGFSFTDRGDQNDIRDRVLDLGPLPEAVQEAVDGLPDDVGVEREGDGLPIAA